MSKKPQKVTLMCARQGMKSAIPRPYRDIGSAAPNKFRSRVGNCLPYLFAYVISYFTSRDMTNVMGWT